MPLTLVTGATGAVGGAVAEALAGAGAAVRVMCRRTEQVDELRSRGVEAVRGDLSDPASVRAALAGCEQLFLLPPATPDLQAHVQVAVDAARETGVRHVVKVSASDANPRSHVPWAADHARADEYLRASGLAWTLLLPSCFMDNLLPMAPAVRRGLLPGTSGRGATTWIASSDVAAAAVRVLGDPATHGGDGDSGRRYLLTGTPPLSFPDVASVLSDRVGHRVRYLHLPGPVLGLGLRLVGTSRWAADGLVHQFGEVMRHELDGVRTVSDDLESLLGRPPVDLGTWVDEHRATFVRGSGGRPAR